MRKLVLGAVVGLAVAGGGLALALGNFLSVVRVSAPWVLLPDSSSQLAPLVRDEVGITLIGAWACPAPLCPTNARLLIAVDKLRKQPANADIEKRMRAMVWQPAFAVPPTYAVYASQEGTVRVQTRAGIKFADVLVRVRSTPAGVAYYILQTHEDNRIQAERMLDKLMPAKG